MTITKQKIDLVISPELKSQLLARSYNSNNQRDEDFIPGILLAEEDNGEHIVIGEYRKSDFPPGDNILIIVASGMEFLIVQHGVIEKLRGKRLTLANGCVELR